MSKRKSVMQHKFSEVPKAQIQRSSFDRSSGHKTAFNSDYLYPIFVDEALPGDTFNLDMTALARLATPIFPLMDNIRLSSFFFFVPNRLIWDNWQKFNGEQDNPGDSTDYVMPTMQAPASGHAEESLSDYMGIPTKIPDLKHSCLWHRAYNLIHNSWFRDENLQAASVVDKDDGPDNTVDYFLLKRGKRHDYFTSALPWPQKDNGNPVLLPLGTSAPVISDGSTPNYTLSNAGVFNSPLEISTNAGGGLRVNPDPTSTETAPRFGDNSGLSADLTNATAATINELRQAFAVQRLFERDARGGTRYTEIIKSHFQVTSPDARLQRPEYLGGGSSPVNISPIAQTTPTGIVPDVSPQGNLAAIGTAQLHNHGFTKSFTEHGVIIGLICATADITYQTGLNRMFSRETRFDHYWPALSHIGEQAVKNKEIWAVGSADLVQDEATFGYQERYAEYRYKPSIITGRFRSNATTPLDAWHLSEKFTALPVLNGAFIESNTPVDRVVAVTTEPEFIFDSYIQLRCARPMPVYGVPGMIDHF